MMRCQILLVLTLGSMFLLKSIEITMDFSIKAMDFKMEYIDATCPLVSKVHKEAENLHKNNYHILLIGHLNHPEVIGTMGQLPKDSIELLILLKLHFRLMIQKI